MKLSGILTPLSFVWYMAVSMSLLVTTRGSACMCRLPDHMELKLQDFFFFNCKIFVFP